MSSEKCSRAELLAEIARLRLRLEEAEDTLRAIGSGEVDAFVVSGADGEQVFTLKGAEQPYRVLMERMNEGAATLASDGTVHFANRRLATLLQIPLERVMGTPFVSYLAPADQPGFMARLANQACECDQVEMALSNKNGESVPILLSCCALESSGGDTEVGVIVTDLSEQKRNEESSRRLNRLYAMLSATNQVIVRTMDRETIFNEFCRIAVEEGGFRLAWVGLVEEESGEVKMVAAQGATGYLQDLKVTVNEEPHGLGPTGIALREGNYYICNDFLGSPITRPWHARGRAHGIRASASIALKQEKRVIGALTLYSDTKEFFDQQQVELLGQMGTDISFALDNIVRETRHQKAELALREETAKRLEAVENLREKERLLLAQSRQAAMGEMIGNIAHQWRQPLNSLGLTVQQLLLFYDLGEFSREFLALNVESSMNLIKHMSKTIDDFRNYFRPEKEKVDFKLRDAVEKTLALLEGSFQNPPIKVEVVVQDDPIIHGYQNEFAQVLLNLMMNARDVIIERAIAEATVTITLREEEGRAVLTVADNAGGIPEGILAKIFDPYFTTKGPQQGTGVGLFMSKNIIEKNMAGRLSARNLAHGAEFRIEV